jgi:hypothetical protein
MNDQKEPLISDSDMALRRTFFKNSLLWIRFLSQIFLAVIIKFWRLCTTGLLIIVLLFFMHGGALAFTFLVFGVLGRYLLVVVFYL